MCGGALEINNNETVATCEYCGTQQTLPKLDDDRRANLYDRANHFRRNNEFDKAMGIYEQILNEDSSDSEAYWSLVLCRYGIEYVEDPSSHKRIPTVNRAQFTSIFDDDNYKSALEYADDSQKSIFEEEAKIINEIQKGILAISQKEEPFDIFICYKETDNNGRRTPDSVLAQDLYYQLKQEGFKVFFSRITLEDKLGSAYEPYIFAALNSAKVMVVLGTKTEFFNAVWVKNEWSRYLTLIKNGSNKMLIPAYKDMDPYDLPEEFSHLQAQDMSKLGFMQDLIRGIKKIVKAADPKPATVVRETIVSETKANIEPLLKRAFIFLEDGEWDRADDFCEQVLNQDPENAQAYLGKLMAELKVTKQDQLKDRTVPFDFINNYQKAIRFADEKLKSVLVGYIEHINSRNENARIEGIYNNAITAMRCAKRPNEHEEAANLFKSIINYKDSETLIAKCLENAETARKDIVYNNAIDLMSKSGESLVRFSTVSYEKAIERFQSISGWKDADEKVLLCQQKIDELKAQAEADRVERERKAEIARNEAERIAKRNKKIAIIVCALIALFIVLKTVIIPTININSAIEKYGEEFVVEFKNLKVGDTYKFGAYEQDNNTSNGKEKIEWLVLDKQNNKALVISKYALDCKTYTTNHTNVTWETCTLRKWLNNDFINSAFSADEKTMIPTVKVSADKNPEYSTNPGKATQDQVFLLSIAEANKYFNSDSARQCKPTDFAVANGSYTGSFGGNCSWWLRSPGDVQRTVAIVYRAGDIFEDGYNVNFAARAVRPALWIDLNS